MTTTTWLSALMMAVGIVLVLRAAAIVMTHGGGRFRGDPVITLLLGFALVLLGQYLLKR